jgi:micrococcal nuclease
VRVIDAERLVLRVDGEDVRVRLIGVDQRFPETIGCSSGVEQVVELLGGGGLRIEFDSRRADGEGWLLAWLWAGDELVNASILRSGAASLSRYWPDQRYEDALQRAQLAAARSRDGLWASCPRLRQFPGPGSSDRTCDPSYPGRCVDPFPPDLDCDEVPFANFRIAGPDLHDLDGDGDGLGCERFNPM